MVEEILEVARPVPFDIDNPPLGFTLVSNQAGPSVVGVANGFLWYRPEPHRTIQQGGVQSETVAGKGSQRFSDRHFMYGPDNLEADFDPERLDNIRLTITRSLPRLVEVEIELLSWGNHRFRLKDLGCEAGTMSGVGDGVGPNIREALYVLSVRATD
jgi:hypothetical protein